MIDSSPRSKPTLQDVADRAGVHLTTASRALGGSKNRPVSERVRTRVHSAASELGYVVDEAARSLRTSRSRAIGVLIPDLGNPVMPYLVQGAERVLAEYSYVTLFADTENRAELEEQRLAMFFSWRVSGVILATARRDEDMPVSLRDAGVPVVLMGRLFRDNRVSSVTTQEEVAVSESVAHLMDLGHRRIAFVGVPLWTSSGFDRHKFFLEQMQLRALPVPEGYAVAGDGYSEQSGRDEMEKLLRRADPPTAVICGNDMMALGCLAALAEHGLRCPDDVSVIGYHDMALTDRVSPPLTTVQVPLHDIGESSAMLLVDEMAGRSAGKRDVRLLPRLVVRQSTGPVAS